MTTERLEHEAVVAHRRGIPWRTWWPTVAQDVERIEPHDTAAYRRLVARLLCLVVSGNLNGRTPPGDALVPQTPDVPKPSDTTTNAKINWGRARVVPADTLPILTPPLRGIGTVQPMTDDGAREPATILGSLSFTQPSFP